MPATAVKMRMARGIRQVLIQWVDQPASAATWEDLHSFMERYPHFQLEDKLLVEGGEMLCGANTMAGGPSKRSGPHA